MLRQDLRYAIRSFRRTPGFTAAAVVSLALGIGANTSIFSIASALLLRSLPYRDADRLVILWNRSPGIGIAEDWFSTAQYFDVKHGHGGFEAFTRTPSASSTGSAISKSMALAPLSRIKRVGCSSQQRVAWRRSDRL